MARANQQSVVWWALQESTGEELEAAYRSEVWAPQRGRVQRQPQGLLAARVDLLTFAAEAKAC